MVSLFPSNVVAAAPAVELSKQSLNKEAGSVESNYTRSSLSRRHVADPVPIPDLSGLEGLKLTPIDDGEITMARTQAAEGEWYHAWYHLVCIIAGAGTLAYPSSYAYLGWTAGIICWLIGITFAFYTSYIIAIVVDDLSKQEGFRFIRYRDICVRVWGPRAGVVAIVPWQYINVVGISVALMIGAGQGLQGIQTTLQPKVDYDIAAGSPVPLYGYIMICCLIWWLTALIPDFHKLRMLSLLALICFVVFSSIIVALCFNHGSIHDAAHKQKTQNAHVFHDFEGNPTGSPSSMVTAFGVMNSLGTIAFAYGNCILPEVMGTLMDTADKPVRKAMFKAFNYEFALVAPYYLLVGIAGYWAYGFSTTPTNFVLAQLLPAGIPGLGNGDGPAWVLVLANLAVFVQAIPSCQVYNQVLYDVFDPMLVNPDLGVWSLWNFTMRTIIRTLYIIAVGFVACLLPFFGNFLSLIGSLSVIPSVFVVPCLLHMYVSKPATGSWLFWTDCLVAFISFAVGVMGTISSIYTIKVAASNFSIFSNFG